MALLCLQNGGNSPQKKNSFTSLINIYFLFSKNWIKFIMISKIELKSFQINLMLELFMCLMFGLLLLLIKFYSLKVSFFLSNF